MRNEKTRHMRSSFMEHRIYDIEEQDFAVTRRSLAEGVSGLSLIPRELANFKLTLTKVEPGGKFSTHRDEYHHVLYFISGIGIGWLEEEQYDIKPGRIAEIPAGTLHGYMNSSNETMTLITVNIPQS
jgi:mannose-6-phosphate isomerase-like protein (cupin superfamily)